MNETYSHKILNSFYLWFDHTLLSKVSAFQNFSSPLYYTKDDRVDDNFVTYSSPFKQWVADSSVPGAIIPTGISGNAGFIGRAGGVTLDFENGRVWFNSTSGSNLSLSGSYAVKNLNTYVVAGRDMQMFYDSNYHINSRFGLVPQSGVNPIGYALPACFIMNTVSDNKPFAFGGQQDTKNKMRVVVVSDNIYDLDGCVSLFRDMTESIIPLISIKDDPFNEYGDLKNGGYNYDQLAHANQGRYAFIEKVISVKGVSPSQTKINQNLKFAVLDFYLSEPRFPKLDI